MRRREGGEGDGWEERGGGEEGEGYRAGDQRGMQSLIPILYTGEKEQYYSYKKKPPKNAFIVNYRMLLLSPTLFCLPMKTVLYSI